MRLEELRDNYDVKIENIFAYLKQYWWKLN